MTPELEALLERLTEVAPPIIAAHAAQPNRCIMATAIGLEVLRYFGVPARPRSIMVRLFNPAWTEWAKANKHRADIPESEQSAALLAVGARVLVVGRWPGWPEPPEGDGYDGHLVIAVDGGLLDLDMQQFNRPAKGIAVPPAAYLGLPEDEAMPDGGWIVNGCLLHALPNPDQSWKTAPDWRERRARFREACAEIIRAVKP